MNQPSPRSRRPHLGRLLGALLGLAAGLAITSSLAVVPSSLLSSLALASGASLSSRALQPMLWWAVLGVGCGSLIGTASVLAQTLQTADAADGLQQRAIGVGALALAGLVAGHQLSGSSQNPNQPHPRDILRSASALTTGIFAVLVTVTFIHSGLDQARTFSSRLSTSLTILVASLSVPGWLAHLLRRSHPPLNHG